MKKIVLIILIIFSNPVIGDEGSIFNCSSKVGLGLDLLNNIYSYKDQGIQENFKLKLNPKEIKFVSGKIKRNYKIITKRNKLDGSMILVTYHINNDYYGGYMLTLSINNKNKQTITTNLILNLFKKVIEIKKIK